ncbi:MAG: ABC transporter substrate-binding protein, partial [Prevotellaceae bacterium]|nr:ABC transporter substrate-binding protein [Prevotellaceae bacterium]
MKVQKLLIAAILMAITSIADGKIIFTPPWMPQAQFAGVYVALDKGYFADEGLDVEIKHIKQSTRQSAVDLLKSGEADIIIIQFAGALIARDQGVPLVNVLQTSQNCGLVYVSKKPVTSYKQLQNKKIATWENGFREISELAFFEKGLKVNWIPSLSVVNLYVANAVDGMLAYSFNEYLRLLMAIGEISNKNVLHFSDIGYNYPEEGIYTT